MSGTFSGLEIQQRTKQMIPALMELAFWWRDASKNIYIRKL
jgi:hypothetical protein